MDMTDIALARIERLAAEMEDGIETAVLDDGLARGALALARRGMRLRAAGMLDSHATQGGLVAVQRAVEIVRCTPRYPDAPWQPWRPAA